MFQKIYTYMKFIRIQNGFLSIFTILVFSFIAFGEIRYVQDLIFLAVITFFSLSAGNIINDIFDYEIDKINQPSRILPSGKLSLKEAKLVYGLLIGLAILLSLRFSESVILLVIINNVLLFIYSWDFKKRALIGNLTVSYLTASVLILCGLHFSTFNEIVLPVLFAFFCNLAREMIKDIEDIEGDKQLGLSTFAVRFPLGVNKTLIYSIITLFIMSCYIPFLVNNVSKSYIYLSHISIIFPLIYLTIKLKQAKEKKQFTQLSKQLKLIMLLGLFTLIWVRNDITIPFTT